MKYITISAIVIIICILSLAGCSKTELEQKTQDYVIQDSLIIEYQGIDSMNVLEILLMNHEVNMVESGMGTFVKGIDSIDNGSVAFWLYSVNDTIGDRSADNYMTKNSDVVKWHYRFINQPDNIKDSLK